MSSQIHITLASLLENPKIKVTISSEKVDEPTEPGGYYLVNTATVEFEGQLPIEFGHYKGDGSVGLVLSRDFSYFRTEANHSRFMRVLFEHGISFTVHH